MVESGGLENRCTRKGTVGSNPTLSAKELPIVDLQLSISDAGFSILICDRRSQSQIGNRPSANSGEVQEWLNWQHWKCCVRETVPWVRIPPSPPQQEVRDQRSEFPPASDF